MRITTLVKNYFFYFLLLLCLFGHNNTVYSQCPTVTNANQSFCDTQSPTIASLVATDNGGGVKWYATATSTTALSSSTSLINGEDYFADDNTGTCGTRQSVIVKVYSAPTGPNFQGVCVTSLSQATPTNSQFAIVGNNLKWYTTPSGGTALSNTAVLSDNTIYYISQTNPATGCETSRLQLFVNVGLVPVPTGNAVQEFCHTGAMPTVGDLVASGNNNWYLTSAFGIPLDLSTPLVNGQFYYATTVDPPCESSDRFEVLVNIYEPNNAGIDGARGICIEQVPTTPSFDLFSLLGGTPDNTGVWTGPLATINGSQGTVDPSTMTLAGSPYVFTYTVTSALCAPDTSTVTITINPIPTVTVSSAPVCQGIPATVTATPSPAGTYTYVWTVPSGATNPGNVATFTTSTAGVYSVIATNTTTTCPAQPAQTTVVINPIPTVTVSSAPVCQGTPATVTATPSPAGTYTYVWTVPSGATNPGNVATFTTTTAGVYSVIATNTTTTCPAQPAQTTVVINPIPTVTVSSAPVCQGTPATVTATPSPAGTYTYVWTVPSGATNPGNVATFTTTTAGVYSVIATNTTTTCPAQPAQTTVVINPIPTVTVSSAPVCQGTPATVTATPSPAGTYTYVWTVPSGATNPGNVATFTTTTAGVYSVIATNTTTTCPAQPAQTTVVINPIPTVTVSSAPVCQGIPATVTATPSPAGTYTYVWTVPSGATNPGNVATFTTSTAGVYSVIATNTTTTCPAQPAQTTVVINPIPTVTVSSAPVCQGTPATVTATPSPAGTYTYVWTVPSGATNPGNVATFTTTTAGVYSVIATNTTTTCPAQPAQTTVVINPIPTVTVSSAPVCQGTPATVTATPSPAGTYTYVWTVPSGATNPGNVATFTTTTAGVYSVIATNTTTTCPAQPAQTTVVINPIPTVTVSSAPVCQGTPATVTATPSPAGTYTYVWTVPSGATNPGNVATFTTTTAGVYSVIATNTTTTCPAQPAQTTVVINPIPTVTVSSAPVCQGIPATVTATPSPAGTYTYVWTVPSGATNPGNVATFTTSTAGVYSVIATNTTTTCPALPAQTTVVINPLPTVTVSSAPVCQGTPATVTATPSPAGTYTYVWTVPSGATNPGNVATFTTTTAGVYSVIATNTTTTCPAQPAQTTVVINPIPTVTVSSAPVCQGTPATVTATPSPAGTYTYVWTVPSGATNPGNVATFTTTTAGVYSVIATNTTTTCPAQPAQTTVVINPIPTVTVSSAPVCQGTPATVTATPSPAGTYTYLWTVPSGATNPGNVATFTTTTAGVYSVIATNTTTTCPAQPAQTTVVINPIPTVTVSSAPVCQGTPATVTATPSPVGTYTYLWTVPSGATNPGNVATFTTTTAGVYSVIATNTTTTCPAQPAQTTVVINPIPTVTVSSAPVCQGTPATVTATPSPAGTYTYVWTVPSGATNPGNVATFTTTTAGVYSVIATNTTTTCPALPAQTTVVINPLPTVTVSSAPVCQGTPATVTATPSPAGTYTYVWTVPSGATNPGNVATFTTTTAGVYSVIATNTTTTCPAQPAQTTVVINPIPTVTVSSAPVCQGTPATVTATPSPAGTYTYVWTVPSGATNPGNVATFTTTTAGVYSVIATNTTTTCPAQPAQTTVVINPIPTVTVSSAPVCQGTPATVTATPSPAGTYTYLWTVPSGATNPGNVATFTTTTAGVYSVIATNTTTTCPAQPAQTTVVINPIPTVTVSSAPVCQGTPATVTATPSPVGTYTYLWTVPSGATNPGNVATFTTTTAGVYSVIATNTTTTCPAQPAQTTVVINPIPTVTVSSAPVCQGTPATVTATPSPAGTYTYVWTVPSGATNPGNVATFTTTTAGVYSVIATNTTTTCPALPAQTTVVINPIPDAGIDAPLTICSNQNSVDLIASLGGTPQLGGTWSPPLASGTGIFNPAIDTSGVYTYTITGIAPCIDDISTVTVTVVQGPEAGANNTLTICVNNPPKDLFLLLGPNAQTGGTWSPPMASGTGLFDPAVDPQGDYVYTLSGTAPCSSDSATISVTVNPIPDAGIDAPKTFCSNGTSEDLFLSLGGTPQAGGTWSPALASGTGVFNPAVDTAGAYAYTVGGTCVTPSTATVTVAIVTAPNSGGTGQTLNTCADITSFDLSTGLNGTQGSGTWNDDDATNALTNNIFNPSTVGVGTYHFTYTVIGTSPCANATSTVTVIVNPLSNPGTAVTIPPVCTSVGTIDLNTLITGQDAGGTWSTPSPVNISGFTAGTYTYTYSVTNSCGTHTTDVNFTVLPNPILTNANVINASACVGADALINLTGMVDGTYSLNYSLSGSNTLANQTATVVISGGVGNFTVPATSLPNTGTTTITFTTIQDTASTCQVTLTGILATITVKPLVQISNTNIAVSSICIGSNAVVEISNAVNLPDGIYQFDYVIPTATPPTGNSGDVTITGGVGQFSVPASVFATIGNYTITISGITITNGCSNTSQDANITFAVVGPLSPGTAVTPTPSYCTSVGTIDLNTLLTGQDAGGTWSTPSPVNISSFVAGTYTYTYSVTNTCGTFTTDVQFTVLPNPILTNTNISNAAACVGTDAVVNLAGMVDGTYSLNYSLSGSNILANQTITVVISGGVGSFTVPTISIPNTGTTTITFNTIQDTTSTCQVTLTAILATITVNPLVQINNTNIAVSSVCIGSNAIVEISNAINLPDGVYQFDYSIPTGTPATGNSGDVTITGGVGQFSVPASVIAAVGNYTITVTGITTITGCSNTSQNANITFAVVAPLSSGTAVTPTPSYCTSVGTIDLTTLLTGQDAGGTWSTPSPIDVSAFAAGTYTYTYSVTNACGTFTTDVHFIILPNPVITSANITNATACIGTDVVVNLTGMVDGSYTLNYDLNGSNTLANQTATVVISGTTGSFTIPAANVPNTGITIITFTTIQDTALTCQTTLTNVAGSITINPIVQIDNTNLAVSSVCINSNAVVDITNAVNLPDGVYQFDYTIPTGTPSTGNSGDVTITGGVGQFTIPASVIATVGSYTLTINTITTTIGCSNTNEDANITFTVVAPLSAGTAVTPVPSYCASIGVLDLASLLTNEDAGGGWTDSNGQAVTSPLNIINFTAGTYSYTYSLTNACGSDSEVVQFTILATPQLATFNVSVSPACLGSGVIVSLNGMVDGTYTLNYDLSGSNTLAGQSVIVTIASGIGSFTVPSASLPNVGTTVITFTSIVNNTTTCSNTLTNVVQQIIIRPLADVDNTNLSVTNVCFGNGIVVNISGATNLPDDVYQFSYSIPNGTPIAGNSGNVTITSGAGQFAIPSSVFPTAGNYTLTINGIVATTACTNANENATVSFVINPIPNTTGATVAAQDTCTNIGSVVTISGATSLADGNYSITYQLSGANTATATVSVTFTGGATTFTITGTDIVNNGNTTITINNLTATASTCGITGTVFPIATFNVAPLATPVLNPNGELFCGTLIPAPTIASLSANIVGTPTVIWYNANIGGTAYSDADLLVNGTTYYGALVSANGCESATRLPVKVDLTVCDVVIPDGFSPNNDGINDTFEIPHLAILFPNFKLEIYNRYGSLVYKGDINVPNWDGTTTVGGLNLGDKLLPTGVYFYILDFNDGIKSAIQGRVYLNR
ncbi:gliding motility-associated C-terminal domain-containing protein [Flavobacterium sp. N1994]|uniref:T9SS type B sorting domain-containing protein n=1 Tax=Flavobacterium sp. N1994 TaxID=2986827 RepID=UPI0022238B8C|nr:gliding motility-associated C-terminal domain-containing protein [Flavobacterium sp. N1994]